MKFLSVSIITCVMAVFASAQKDGNKELVTKYTDMFTPAYYLADQSDPFKTEVDRFVAASRKETFHHPLQDEDGRIPEFKIYNWGTFGAGKGPGRDKQHHPALDYKVGDRETEVSLYALYEGRVSTFRDAPKYRHYLAITKDVSDEDGKLLGKVVTIYGHIDLDLNEADGLSLDGKLVKKGDLVSRHLYSGTMGGPHLHLEIRYYKPGEKGDESFYGFKMPGTHDSDLSEPSAGPWPYGYWNPNIGYGYADPGNHGIARE